MQTRTLIIVIVLFWVVAILGLVGSFYYFFAYAVIPEIHELERTGIAEQYTAPLGLAKEDIFITYVSDNSEVVVFMKDGIISNRYEYWEGGYVVYVPKENIQAIYDESPCKGGLVEHEEHLLALETDLMKEGTKIVQVFEDGEFRIPSQNEVTYLNNLAQYESGIILFEFMTQKTCNW